MTRFFSPLVVLMSTALVSVTALAQSTQVGGNMSAESLTQLTLTFGVRKLASDKLGPDPPEQDDGLRLRLIV